MKFKTSLPLLLESVIHLLTPLYQFFKDQNKEDSLAKFEQFSKWHFKEIYSKKGKIRNLYMGVDKTSFLQLESA